MSTLFLTLLVYQTSFGAIYLSPLNSLFPNFLGFHLFLESSLNLPHGLFVPHSSIPNGSLLPLCSFYCDNLQRYKAKLMAIMNTSIWPSCLVIKGLEAWLSDTVLASLSLSLSHIICIIHIIHIIIYIMYSIHIIIYMYNYLWGGGSRVWTQGLMLAGQIPYHLSHTPDLIIFYFHFTEKEAIA
jgi:hypothetical protein